MSNINNVMKGFKAFTLKGNIINMAVGVVINGAFNKIVTSPVGDILIPLLGALTGGASLDTPKYVIHPAATVNEVKVAEAVIPYGGFLQDILDLLITGVCMFFMIKTATVISSRLRHKEEAKKEVPAPIGPTREELLAEIRDLLKGRGDIA